LLKFLGYGIKETSWKKKNNFQQFPAFPGSSCPGFL
jgi:hypothetical protein